jgi:hypothetical protein
MNMKFRQNFILYLSFILLNQLIHANLQANNKNKFDIFNHYEQRIYINKESIVITDQGLFFVSEAHVIPLSCLRTEGNQFYINKSDYLKYKDDLKARGIWGDTWTCPKPTCRYENYESIDYYSATIMMAGWRQL